MYLSGNVTDESESNLVGPGKREELAPPSGDHLRHVEPSEEGYGDEATEPPGIDAQQLEVLAVPLVLKQDCPGEDICTWYFYISGNMILGRAAT